MILSHAPELTDGNRSREIFSRITRSPVSFGALAVDGFFILSGYLILQSWMQNPTLGAYLRKRCLRILPGYFVAVFLSTLVIGLVAGTPHFFQNLFADFRFIRSILLLGSPETPTVFPGMPFLVNGTLWTIFYESRCYLLVALLGLLLLGRTVQATRIVYLSITGLLLIPLYSASIREAVVWRHHLQIPLGDPVNCLHLAPVFLVGCCYFLFKEQIPYRAGLAVMAALIMLVTDIFTPAHLEFALVLCGGYLLFFFGRRANRGFSWMRGIPDISYGIYLYGGPVESYLVWKYHASPWLVFAVSTPVCVLLGWLSWHLVESPALSFKRPTPTGQRSLNE